MQQSKLGNSFSPSPAFTKVNSQCVFCNTRIMEAGISQGIVGLAEERLDFCWRQTSGKMTLNLYWINSNLLIISLGSRSL